MSMRNIASLGCKILGLFSIIQGLDGSSNVFSVIIISTNNNSIETSRIITLIASFLLPIIFGFILWIFSDKLSVIMVKEDAQSNIGLVTKGDEIQRIAFSVLGL